MIVRLLTGAVVFMAGYYVGREVERSGDQLQRDDFPRRRKPGVVIDSTDYKVENNSSAAGSRKSE